MQSTPSNITVIKGNAEVCISIDSSPTAQKIYMSITKTGIPWTVEDVICKSCNRKNRKPSIKDFVYPEKSDGPGT